MQNLRLVLSEDGSHTLYNTEIDETYHSIHGAIQESDFVFIHTGLEFLNASQPKRVPEILEVGFGTGLNAFLTAIWAEKNKVSIVYTTLETFPLPDEITEKLNFKDVISLLPYSDLFAKIHQCSWGDFCTISPYFKLKKVKKGIEQFEEGNYNLIYFDAFAPAKQPELWHLSVFDSIARLCQKHAVFVTYCAKGQVRRDLQTVGFNTERLPGPPGKREMLRGVFKI